ncbi:ATP-binding cassette domain-containing protein [Roseovarius sp. LXJ103]|uniref:ATP-binding cassette domain-containing protein n=1 Tax=Roseovarius carneus TaxID=2853164 RepID=UPI000D60E126|nr:ATP-binding cassette domain-containing protein [Roseovarius carneus]MBZ8119702.1 ATP-binding cassette domain-containing protein [Roseovarius carneus]PWE34689.1 ABC transporter ATP-binding protein [Pelagicola sp. LXJ1103]
MTNPPVTLSITSGGIKPVPSGVQRPQPTPANSRYGERAEARARLAAVYASILGVDVVPRDLLDAMVARAAVGDQVQPQALADGLEACGMLTEVVTIAHMAGDHWPALAQMTSGQFILVLEQRRGALIVYDTTCTDNRAEVPVEEFEPFFTGIIVRAEASLAEITRSHVTAEAAPHWFWGQFRAFRRHFAEVALGSFVANLLAVAVALFALQVYDRVIPHQSEATLWVLAAGCALALLMEAFLKIARARLMDGAGRQIEVKVQGILMERLLGMRSEIASRSPSMLFSSMREFSSVREFFTASTVGTLVDIPFLFVFLLLVASIGGNVVWVLIIGGIIMIVPGFLLQKRMIRLTEETQGASAKSSRLLHEAVFELDTLKTQRAEDRFRRLWAELTTLSALKSSDQRKLASALTFWSQGGQQATYVAAIITCTYMVFAGALTVGSIIAVSILTSRTLAPLTQLAGTMARWGNVKSALDGLESIAGAAQDTEAERTYLRRETTSGGYELSEMQFFYEEGDAPTLDIPAIKLPAGQAVAILGSNGSGKSTLLKVLSGLYAPSKGRVMLDGVDMAQVDPRDLRRLIGYLGQDVRLFTGTLRENLNLNLLERDDERLLQSLDFAGLGPFVRGHAKGLDLEILDGGQGLSQGQRQSIGWARLWLQDPKICLLDEPTAALDQTLERTLVSRLETWLAGRTAIIATHRVPILSLTSRTLILQNGRMAVDGPRDQVLAHLASTQGGA